MDFRINDQLKKQAKSTKLGLTNDKKDYEDLNWFSDSKNQKNNANHNQKSVFPFPLNNFHFDDSN